MVVLAGLLVSLLNRPSEPAPVVAKATGTVPMAEIDVMDSDLGLKPMTVPEPPVVPKSAPPGNLPTEKSANVGASMSIEEQALSMPFLWAVDLGEVPPLESRLPETSLDPEPYAAGTGHPEQGFKIIVIFSGQLDRDTYNQDDRNAMHRELAAFAETQGYDLAIDVDAVRGRALRPVYFASEKVDRTAAFNAFLEAR